MNAAGTLAPPRAALLNCVNQVPGTCDLHKQPRGPGSPRPSVCWRLAGQREAASRRVVGLGRLPGSSAAVGECRTLGEGGAARRGGSWRRGAAAWLRGGEESARLRSAARLGGRWGRTGGAAGGRPGSGRGGLRVPRSVRPRARAARPPAPAQPVPLLRPPEKQLLERPRPAGPRRHPRSSAERRDHGSAGLAAASAPAALRAAAPRH